MWRQSPQKVNRERKMLQRPPSAPSLPRTHSYTWKIFSLSSSSSFWVIAAYFRAQGHCQGAAEQPWWFFPVTWGQDWGQGYKAGLYSEMEINVLWASVQRRVAWLLGRRFYAFFFSWKRPRQSRLAEKKDRESGWSLFPGKTQMFQDCQSWPWTWNSV